MTVAELIIELQKMPQSWKIVITNPDGFDGPLGVDRIPAKTCYRPDGSGYLYPDVDQVVICWTEAASP